MPALAFLAFALLAPLAASAQPLRADPYPADPAGVPLEFICAWRGFAAEYSAALRPDAAREAFDALQLATICNASLAEGARAPQPPSAPHRAPPAPAAPAPAGVLYVDGVGGSDANPGTLDAPLRTLPVGLAKSRALPRPAALYLRAATYYLSATLELGSADSGLTVAAYAGEAVWVSGAQLIAAPAWAPFPVANASANVWAAPVALAAAPPTELRVDGVRVPRARFPNSNPETQQFPIGWVPTSSGNKWHPPRAPGPLTLVNVFNDQLATRQSVENANYSGGIGGPCAGQFDPPFSYWCALHPAGGGGFQYYVPSGVDLDAASAPPPFATPAANPPVMHVWRAAHWANWM